LQIIKQKGGGIWVVDAPDFLNNSGTPLAIGIRPGYIEAHINRGQRAILGQFYGIVDTGLILAKHVFQGFKRDMFVENDKKADERKLAATWSNGRDVKIVGGKTDLKLEFTPAPPKSTFAVYISPNEMLEDFPNIYGWADHWAWLPAHGVLADAPIDYENRYDKKLWSAK
jgi:hypothetical protein